MDFQTEVGKLKEVILKNSTSDDEMAPMKVSPSTDEAEAKSPLPKSKSKKRSTYNTDAICTEGINVAVDPQSVKKSTRPRRNLEKKEERPKFSVALSRKEIEEDFISITGKKPPRKPKKHPRSIQNELQEGNQAIKRRWKRVVSVVQILVEKAPIVYKKWWG